MNVHAQNCLIRDSSVVELDEINRSSHNDTPISELKRTPSHISGFTGYSLLDDGDEQSLIPRYTSTRSEQTPDEPHDDHDMPADPPRKRRFRFKSWKVGVMVAAAMTTAVLIVNSVLTIWASASFGLKDGIGTAYTGSCGVVGAWSFWLHILINALSSALLSASNYTMQCVTAPTRRECDLAHARGDWLDVGVPSVRNLFRISRRRRIMWALLALTSTPIHLLYNSAVFKTLDNNLYDPFLVDSKFLDDDYSIPSADVLQDASENDRIRDSGLFHAISMVHEAYTTDCSSFANLTSESCIQTYATYYLSGHNNVILVADNSSTELIPTIPDLYGELDADGNYYLAPAMNPFNWICTQSTVSCKNPSEARKLRGQAQWAPNGVNISYCLSEKQPERCKLQFSAYVLAAVIVCNAIKCASMFWVVFQQHDNTFVTAGDAIASWLDKPDPATANSCFQDSRSTIPKPGKQQTQIGRPINPTTRRWRLGVSKRRWATTISVLVVTLVISCTCLGLTINQMNGQTADTIVSLGFGAVNSNMLADAGLPDKGTKGLASAVLFANLPQLVLSFVYLSYNALITCMLLANEYSQYEIQRKTLRVTTPCERQRSTYWLQMPFTYGVPLIVLSATLHWLISQAVFLVRVEDYKDGELYGSSSSAVGLSPAPMLVIISLGTCLIAVAIGMGHRELAGSSMPVAASCSFALAAASHRPVRDFDAAVLPVRWGEIVEMGNADVGHCCFTSQEVVSVVPGRQYAGVVGKSKTD